MLSGGKFKVYNKENKLKLSIRDTSIFKAVSIYKYIEDFRVVGGAKIEEIEHFICEKENKKLKPYQIYYEFHKNFDGVRKNYITISKTEIEEYEEKKIDGLNIDGQVKFNTKLKSGNVYEQRIVFFNDKTYKVEYKNGELYDFNFKMNEENVREYLNKIKQENEK